MPAVAASWRERYASAPDEAAIDRISFELHELSKLAKDYGSAAVMLSLLVAGAIWAAALWQRFVA